MPIDFVNHYFRRAAERNRPLIWRDGNMSAPPPGLMGETSRLNTQCVMVRKLLLARDRETLKTGFDMSHVTHDEKGQGINLN